MTWRQLLSSFRKPVGLSLFDLPLMLERGLDYAAESRIGQWPIRNARSLIRTAVEHSQHEIDRRLRDGIHCATARVRCRNGGRPKIALPIRFLSCRNEFGQVSRHHSGREPNPWCDEIGSEK